MVLDVFKQEELKNVKPLLEQYKFHKFRNCRMLDVPQLNDYLFFELNDILQKGRGIVVTCSEKNEIVGLCALIDLPWDSAHFKVRSAKIDFLIAPDYNRTNYKEITKVKHEIVKFILSICRRKKIVFLSCGIDVEDINSIHALEGNAFELMDTILTYLYNNVNRKKILCKARSFYSVTLPQEEDLRYLPKLIKKNFFLNRFYNDYHIDESTAVSAYEKWIKNFRMYKTEKVILVAKRKGEIAGFITYELNKNLESSTGVRLFGHGLSWVDKEATGAYVSLLGSALLRGGKKEKGYAEINVPIWNYPAIRVAQYFDLRLIASHYTFHKWLE